MRCLKPVITGLLIGLIGVAGCGGNVVVDGQGAGEGGAGGVSSSGSLSGSLSSSTGQVTSGGQVSSSAGSMSGPAVAVTSGTSGPSGPSGPTNTTATGGTGLLCGMKTCYSVNILGSIDLTPCCPDANPYTCGLDTTPIASFIQFPPGCTEVERPGNLDPSCPDKLLTVMGMMITLPGCCSGGMCGVFADFSGFAPGLNFGCADASDVVQSCGP